MFAFDTNYEVLIPLAFMLLFWPIALIIFIPLWAISDPSLTIVTINEERKKTPEVLGVGNFYYQFVKGYVGISTIFNVVLFIGKEIQYISEEDAWNIDEVSYIVALLIMFLYVLVAFISIGVYYSNNLTKIQNSIRIICKNNKISETIQFQIEKQLLSES
jgi:hypothetical protein